MPKLRYDRKYTYSFPDYLYRKCIHSYPNYLYVRSIHSGLPPRKYIGDANVVAWKTVQRRGWGHPTEKGSGRKPLQSKVTFVDSQL